MEEATNGRVGYVYIPDMGPDGLNEFARYFYPQLDKEALIIDDRANGGGNVSPMIIERLRREPYRLTMRRGSTKIGTIPDATLVGPKVLLINKYSASDGDLFHGVSRQIRSVKLSVLVHGVALSVSVVRYLIWMVRMCVFRSLPIMMQRPVNG